MFRAIFRTVILMLVLVLAACGGSKFRTYNGPPVTLVEVHKADRKLFLISGDKLLKTYDIQLGGVPVGKKEFEGDKRTPEGAYFISQRNPRSTYHLSLRISYPNEADVAAAKAAGKEAGSDIFVHGQPGWTKVGGDWTAGCIAMPDKDMEQVYAMVNPGTPINIFP